VPAGQAKGWRNAPILPDHPQTVKRSPTVGQPFTLEYHAGQDSGGTSFLMNCQEARESLSMLLDGGLGLTERVPLELHVNACEGCQGRLAHLRELRELEQRAGPAPRPVHWRPILAPGFVEKALGAIRAEDVTTRLRRLVAEKVPSRQLAVAAAVPLLVILAVFIFERGFTVGSGMRQRPAPAPTETRREAPVVPPVASIAPTPPTIVTPVVPTRVAPPPASGAPPADQPLGLPRVSDYQPIPKLRDIYFDFGTAAIRPGDVKILDANAAWLRAHPQLLVLIEGHSDNRGATSRKNEFNIDLGEQRAQAAMSHLVAHGVQPSRITILSYGEERPQCTEESKRCWSQNRRSRFLVKPR
jgi:peptidoglycan-associated lipoprotein